MIKKTKGESMISEKQKSIAEQSVYTDLKCRVGMNMILDVVGLDSEIRSGNIISYVRCLVGPKKYESSLFSIKDCFPILRPMSDLTKEVTHKDYNDDKPFIPLNIVQKLYSNDIKRNDFLNLLHFDTRKLIQLGEAISVHDLPKNPYEPCKK